MMGVEAGRTTLEAAVRAGAIIVETAFFGGGGRGDDGRGTWACGSAEDARVQSHEGAGGGDAVCASQDEADGSATDALAVRVLRRNGEFL